MKVCELRKVYGKDMGEEEMRGKRYDEDVAVAKEQEDRGGAIASTVRGPLLLAWPLPLTPHATLPARSDPPDPDPGAGLPAERPSHPPNRAEEGSRSFVRRS